MKSPLIVLAVLILGSLSLPGSRRPEVHHWEYPIATHLTQEQAFERLAPWIEEHYIYSHREYLWDGDSRVIAVRKGVGATQVDSEDLIQYSYRMNIRVENRQIKLLFSDMEPLSVHRSGESLGFLQRNRSEEYRWIRRDLGEMGESLSLLLQ